jgi:hypothetical protein
LVELGATSIGRRRCAYAELIAPIRNRNVGLGRGGPSMKEPAVLRQGVLIIPIAPRAPGAVPRGGGGATVPFVMMMVSTAPRSVETAPGVERIALHNGLTVTIHSAESLRERVATFKGKPVIVLDDDRMIPVITDVDDPSIVNPGDGRFHPFSRYLVLQALDGLEHQSLNMSVTIYLLPYPRRAGFTSATVGTEVFLSPHMLPIGSETAAYIVAHEMGHAFRNWFLPADSQEWDRYCRLRGITNASKFSASASHAYRPKEIFAEDFRVLFGGPAARFGGCIENAELKSPEQVAGLAPFIKDISSGGVDRSFFDGMLP